MKQAGISTILPVVGETTVSGFWRERYLNRVRPLAKERSCKLIWNGAPQSEQKKGRPELMQTSPSQFPDLRTLTDGLTSVFRRNGAGAGQVTVLHREPAIYASTFPSEIVTCILNDGSELRLFCKYGSDYSQAAHGHRGGVEYEAAVYRHVLQWSVALTPRFYGTYLDKVTGQTCLILEYLDNSVRVTKTAQPADSLALAARWIGQFHAANERRLVSVTMPFLKSYDREYYVGWVHRTSLFARHLHARFPWLATLSSRFEEFVAPLLAAPQTVIHGEYYPKNILFRHGIIYPVDWESAAIAAGEIDLATLTDQWPQEIARRCEAEYHHTRWPDAHSADFEATLTAARFYVRFRWMGDRPEWTTEEGPFHRLRCLGEQAGLI